MDGPASNSSSAAWFWPSDPRKVSKNHRNGAIPARLLGDVEDAEAFGREQDDAGALDVLEGPPPIGDDGGQARQVGGAGDYADSLSHPSDSHTSRLPRILLMRQCTSNLL